MANKVEDLTFKMEYLFERNIKQSKLLVSKAMNQRNEEKMYYAVIQHDKLTSVCTDMSSVPEAEDKTQDQDNVMSE